MNLFPKHTNGFINAVNGGCGDLDAWLEFNGERECRTAIKAMILDYEQRIVDLERTNLLLADQLKKREGMWLAPMEPDRKMVDAANGLLKQGSFIVTGNEYKAMRDSWLERNK